MIKSVKDIGSWLFSQSWDIQNTSSIHSIQDKKQITSSMDKLGDISQAKRL